MKLILSNKITSIATMLSTNVLCIKTRRKRSYYVSEASDYIPRPSKDKRSLNATPAMMQITEDTPPDMLAGAMDLTVHLPTETTVKMSVDRSTPMMDLLVQITTAHHLQQSGHILQALEMAPSSGRLDKILPYKPNTPIGVLDTQHVKVIPKNRSIPIPKSVSGGHQPFESTFRLQVHLPRNQLYVIRVSQNVYLEDIMKKVCHEKNLDSSKYEFRHPANLDEVLNPKLTLSDYQITEVYVVFKGTIGLTQTFSANDIMASRKEEERKQMQARTGGGVLSLIFKRGKQSMGSGSISSENRSISPSHSDDSRSVTPPAIQQPLLSSRIQPAPLLKEKPKAPQRKRRPAPKPPQSTEHKKDVVDKAPSEISNVSESNTIDSKKLDNGLTICHSRNSSDSSGYHEPSVLSDNCNTSLPRRSKSTLINEVLNEEGQFEETVSVRSQNLTTMSNFSKSTSSIAGRKKKAAPRPPSILKSEDLTSSSETVTVSIAGSVVSDKTDITETESVVAETVPTNVEAKSLDDIAVDVTKKSAEERQRLINSSNKTIDPIKRSSISSTTSLKGSNSEVIEFEKLNEIVNANLNCDNDRNTAMMPKNVTELESRNSITKLAQNSQAEIIKENHIKDVESQIILNSSPISSVLIEALKVEEKASKKEKAKNEAIVKSDIMEFDDLDHEWQYQLPSPPKAFRDSSPTHSTDLTNYDTITLQDFKEHSILSHSELFEKLGQIKDSQYESESISDFSSVCNEEEKPILSKLTLENLEKRQSLVYNRELSTSLKNAQENNFTSQTNQTRSIDDTNIKRSSVVNELEKAIKTNKPLVRHNSCIADTTLKPFVDHNLPNFKISTYDTFKRKINIFEDESIRSNSDNSFKSLNYNELSNNKSMPYDSVNCFSNKSPMRSQNLSIAKSIENLSIVNIDFDEVDFKKPSEYSKHNSNSKNSFYVKHKSSTLNSAGRSESFSANKWIPQNPVQRSKSQVALNKFNEIEQDITFEDPPALTKSNSLFDVSGLQSLEVIRSIQNKLNTPNNSTEDLLGHKEEPKQSSARSSVSLDPDSAPIVEKSANETTTTKTYRYQGPPSINLSTWSERPKTKVSLKEDTDYKIKNIENCKLNRTSNTLELNKQAIGSADNGTRRFSDSNSCTFQVNEAMPIRTNQDSGNVTIKVGTNQFSKHFSRINKFVQNMENPFVRKPLGNINKIEGNVRPHSMPQDSDFEISRVPIVRAVELKKSIKETTPTNTSVIQINALNNEITNNNKYTDIYQSTERLQEINGLKNQTTKSSVYLTSETTHKPVARGNSFAYSRNLPKVMGFTDIKIENDNTPRSRKSWNVPSNYEPLPLKVKPEPPVRSSSFLPNSNVPFSNLTLKRVESKKPDLSTNSNIYGKVVLRNTTSQFHREEPNQDVPNNEKLNQLPPVRRISNGTNNVPPCPPPLKPIVPKKIIKRPESCADPRDELLNSIRNFGGQKGLRHVKAI